MQAITTIGLDIAKSVFQVHGIDAEGKVLIRRKLKRRYVLAFFDKLPPCLVGIEACANSHYWVAPTQGAWPYRALDAASLREALRQAAEERCR
jgi:transposase